MQKHPLSWAAVKKIAAHADAQSQRWRQSAVQLGGHEDPNVEAYINMMRWRWFWEGVKRRARGEDVGILYGFSHVDFNKALRLGARLVSQVLEWPP